MNSPIQKILFGSPGTGKSFRISDEIIPNALDIDEELIQKNVIKTVFHPEYTYGDFMGKLMPLTDDSGKVEYRFYTGHFLKALGRAYKELINSAVKYEKDKKDALDQLKKELGKNKGDFDESDNAELKNRIDSIEKTTDNVVLVIDEINRGNSAAVFGTVFQLLDRNQNGWSEYPVTISELEIIGLLKEMGFSKIFLGREKGYQYWKDDEVIRESEYKKYISYIFDELPPKDRIGIENSKIKLPPNLSILATMNTSDSSIYFMDSAFKRRWDWEFINVEDDNTAPILEERFLHIDGLHPIKWKNFVDKTNKFIRSHHNTIRKIEDKQIGYFFINEETINEEHIKNKLMFFIWDSVFANNKDPLVELIFGHENRRSRKSELVTFGQFTKTEFVKTFVERISSIE